MISDLERLAALHLNGQLDDTEFKLAKEKLLQGSRGEDQIALRLELTEAQIKLNENEKNWSVRAKNLGTISLLGMTPPPNQWVNFACLSLSSWLLYSAASTAPALFKSKFVSGFTKATMLLSMFLLLILIGSFAFSVISHKTRLQRFLAAQAEHNAEQSALRNRIAQLQQQLT